MSLLRTIIFKFVLSSIWSVISAIGRGLWAGAKKLFGLFRKKEEEKPPAPSGLLNYFAKKNSVQEVKQPEKSGVSGLYGRVFGADDKKKSVENKPKVTAAPAPSAWSVSGLYNRTLGKGKVEENTKVQSGGKVAESKTPEAAEKTGLLPRMFSFSSTSRL